MLRVENIIELIESLQLLIISNKHEDTELYEECIRNLTGKDLSANGNELTDYFRKLKIAFDDDNRIEESELRRIPQLFELDDIGPYKHEQLLELLCTSIMLLDEYGLSARVLTNLFKNIEAYFESKTPKIVSFTSLFLVMFYLYKSKYKDDIRNFERTYDVEAYLDQEPENRHHQSDDIHKNAFAYLRLFLNDKDISYKIKSHKLCHWLNVTLSIGKMLDFSLINLDEKPIKNLVMFVGPTGVGKSTVINYLSGTEYDLVLTVDGHFLIPKEGHFNKLKCTDKNTYYSETLYPEILPYDDQLNFADMPGFFDYSSTTSKSIIATLGVPLLMEKVERIKAIVIVLDYIVFDRNRNDRGQQFENISRNLFQLFRDFEKNSEHLNILFAITKPSQFSQSIILEYIKRNVKYFQRRLESELERNELTRCETRKNDSETKIKVYDDLITALKETSDQSAITKIKKYFISYIRNVEDNFAQKFDTELCEAYQRARGNNDMIRLQVENWENEQEKLRKIRHEDECFLNERHAEKLMIKLILNAIERDNVFIFRCFSESNGDDRQKLLDKLKQLNENFVQKSLVFKFESNQEYFKKIRSWCLEKVTLANSDSKLLLDLLKLIQNKDKEIENKQREILSLERDLDVYMRPVKLKELASNDLATINILKEKHKHVTDVVSSYKGVIEELTRINKKLNNLIVNIHKKSYEYNNKYFLTYTGLNSHWPLDYEYPFGRKSGINLFGRTRSFIPLQEVFITFWNLDLSYMITNLRASCYYEKDKLSIKDVGTLEIIEIDFPKGIFKAKFLPDSSFNGHVEFRSQVKGTDVDEIKAEEKANRLSIDEYENKKNQEANNLSAIEKKIDQEKNLIEKKLELIKDNTSKKKLPILESRLTRLNYDLEKFIKYLLQKDTIKYFSYAEIESVFSLTQKAKVTQQDDLEVLMKNLKLNDQEPRILILDTISKEIGLSITCIVSLIQNLCNRKNNVDENSLEKERDSLIETREKYVKSFGASKSRFAKQQTNLAIFNRIRKILNFKNDHDSNFREYDNLTCRIKNERILEIDLGMRSLSEIKLEETDILAQEQSIQEIINSELKKYSSVPNKENYKTLYNFTYNFEFEHLYQSSSQYKRNVSIFKLKEIDYEISYEFVNKFKNGYQLDIPLGNFKVFSFFLPQLIHSIYFEIDSWKLKKTENTVIGQIIKRALDSSSIALKLNILLKSELENLTEESAYAKKSLEFIKSKFSKKVSMNPKIKKEIEEQDRFLDALETFSRDDFDSNSEYKLTNQFILDPLDPRYNFVSIKSISKDKHTKSKTKPIEYVFSVVSKQNTLECIEYPILLKTGDDLRKDFLLIQAIEIINKIFVEENLNEVHVQAYKVLPTGHKKGLIQVIESKSVSTIFKEHKSIKSYFNQFGPQAQTKILDNYTKSCAGLLLANYLFGIGDRHFDNIMINPDGIIFHIDFGFIMADEPKQVKNIRLAPEIKWTRDLAEPILNDRSKLKKPHDDENYSKLMENLLKGFQVLRKHSKILVNLFQSVIDSKIPSINKKSVECFESRFLINLTREESNKTLLDKISANYDSYYGRFIDIYHESELLHRIFERN